MREGAAASLLASAASWGCRVTSWLGPDLLADRLPVLNGRVTASTTQAVPDVLKCTIPRYTVVSGRTVDLLPRDPGAPLARFGQQLDVTLEVGGVDTRLGRYLIGDWDYDEDTITVTAPGLLQLVADDRLLEPTSPRTNGTLVSEFNRLLTGGLTAQFEPSLVNRTVPSTMTWDEDRLAALYDIADSWPAVIRVDQWGQVLVNQPPVIEGNTPVVRVPRKDTRTGAYNVVVARSSADGVTASGYAEVTSGPMSVESYGRVPKFYSSPLLLTDEQCRLAAQAMLPAAVRQSSILPIEMAPDPRLELDDLVEVRRGGIRDWGLIVGTDIPLTPADGAMRIDVGVLA
jgi:hypothetical protein